MSLRVVLAFFTDPPRPFSSSVAALSAVVEDAGHVAQALHIPRRSVIADAVERVRELRPDVLAVSTMTRDWPGAHAFLDRVAEADLAPRPFIVVGGYHASLAPQDVARCAAVDAIGIGEGERPLAALLDALDTDQRPARSFAGMWIRRVAGWTDPVPGADPEPDIERLPRWNYDAFGDMREILRDGVNTFGPHVDAFLPTRAGRGCPFTCAYCSAPRWGKLQGFAARDKRNRRSVGHLCKELAELRDRYDPEGFEFWDEHFPIDLEWLTEFAREYPKRVGIPFKVEMHPSAASRARLERLAEAGCSLFHCGIEAGDESFRREILNRRTPDAQLQRVFDDCRALGLETSASLMTMLPGETRENTRSTMGLLHRLRPDSFMFSTYHPLPGTVLGDAAVAEWPGAAKSGPTARFMDHPAFETATPPAMDEVERDDTFAELGLLQQQLVQLARRRPGRDEARMRPVENPDAAAAGPVSPTLTRMLGLAPDAESALPRGRRVTLEAMSATVKVHHPVFGERDIVVSPVDAGPAFACSRHLGVSYRGSDAPRPFLEFLHRVAQTLGDASFDDLRDAAAREA